MGRFSYEDADKYGGQSSGGSFFKIENDMEVKRVRLLGKDMNDFPGYACHEVKIDGKRKLVNCLREYGDPVTVCPFCNDRMKQVAKLFIPLYNIEDEEVQIWERGKSFFPVLSSYCTRHKNVVNYITDVERQGKPHDTNTRYMLYESEEQSDEEVSLDDFKDDIPDIMGRYILDKTADEMDYFLDSGKVAFPDDDDDDIPFETRRRDRRDTSNASSRRGARRSSRRSNDDEEF